MHTSIVSRYLATRDNSKIPPPHISSSGEILHQITRRTLAQLRTNKSPFLKSCCGDGTAIQMDGNVVWLTTSGKIGLPLLARTKGVGRVQQYHYLTKLCVQLK